MFTTRCILFASRLWPLLDGLRDKCILWNTSCSGNRSSASEKFFDGSFTQRLTNNTCFFDSSPDCSTRNPPGRVSAFNDVKDWMRSPQCYSENPAKQGIGDETSELLLLESSFLNYTCCGQCVVAADQVDLYYWSDPSANTSCQSIVGDGNSDLAVGATTDKFGSIYWGCTAWFLGDNYENGQFQTDITRSSLVTTAVLTTVASVIFRTYLYNPWGRSPCETALAPVSSNLTSKIERVSTPLSLHPRGHSLLAPNGSVSTAVLGNFTL